MTSKSHPPLSLQLIPAAGRQVVVGRLYLSYPSLGSLHTKIAPGSLQLYLASGPGGGPPYAVKGIARLVVGSINDSS